MHLFVSGYPGHLGGANTELWHTVKLWRRFGLDVTLIPTWRAEPIWQRRLESIGCQTCETNPDDLQNVRGLAGGVVVSMCNTRFLAAAERFRELGCKIIWLGCMNWLFPEERLHYRKFGAFDRYVFQSFFQQEELVDQLMHYGYDDRHGRVICGAFDVEEFPFRPSDYVSGERFVIGHLSRAAPDKFSPRMWEVLGQIHFPITVRVIGWNDAVRNRVGRPPRWAECLPPCAETTQRFLGQLHCLVQFGGATPENWPRVGLEAMSTGVPVIARNEGGWPEMIRNGRTGVLCDTEDEMIREIVRLANEPKRRRMMIEQARRAIETELADPETWWVAWRELLEEVLNDR